jgi:hypothetical protein
MIRRRGGDRRCRCAPCRPGGQKTLVPITAPLSCERLSGGGGLHRPPLAPCRLLVYQNRHGPRPTSTKSGAARSARRPTGTCCPPPPSAALRRLARLPEPPLWWRCPNSSAGGPLVGRLHLNMHHRQQRQAVPFTVPLSPAAVAAVAARRLARSSSVASRPAMRHHSYAPPMDAVYALKMRMQLCRRHRCGRSNGRLIQSPLASSLW